MLEFAAFIDISTISVLVANKSSWLILRNTISEAMLVRLLPSWNTCFVLIVQAVIALFSEIVGYLYIPKIGYFIASNTQSKLPGFIRLLVPKYSPPKVCI